MSKQPKIRFAGFKDDWEQRNLGDIADICGGGTPSMGVSEYWDGNVDWYAPAEIGEQIFLDGSKRKITKFGLEKSSAKMLPIGTVLFTSRAGIGNTAILQKAGCTNQGFQSIIPHQGTLDSYFIFSRTPELKRYGEIMGAGSTFVEVSGKQMANMDIFIPSMPEQKKIGKLFSQLDHCITFYQRKYDKLVNFKKAMLEKMFPREGENEPEIRFSGFTGAWEQRKFGDLVLIERGGSPRPINEYVTDEANGLNWVKIGDAPLQGNYITRTAEKIKPSGLSKTREVHPGDLVLSNSMSFGRPYIMGIDGCIHDGWLLIRDINKRFNLNYLCCVLGTEQMLSQYKAMAAGSTVNNLNKELVGNTVVKYPGKDEQVKIGQFVSGLDKLITNHQRKLEKLQNIKKSLLEKMFI